MERNIPRAAIHVGTDKKAFSSQVGNEAERRGWDEKRYQLKNADIDKNNHYNYSRKRLNFEILKDGKIVPLGSQSVPLHERLQHRLDELGFKPYMDAKRPDQVSRNNPNCTVGIINLLGAIAAYCMFPKKPCINVQRTLDTQLSLF